MLSILLSTSEVEVVCGAIVAVVGRVSEIELGRNGMSILLLLENPENRDDVVMEGPVLLESKEEVFELRMTKPPVPLGIEVVFPVGKGARFVVVY